MNLIPARFVPTLLTLALLPLAGGCGLFSAPNPVNNQLRREKLDLEAQVADLKGKLEGSERVIKGMREASSIGATQPTLPADRLAKLVTPTGITLGRLTGGVDLDRDVPGDEALRVYVAPTDAACDAIKAAGRFTIEAFDLEQPTAPLIGTWKLDLDETAKGWHSTLLEYTYAFSLPWQTLPTREQITVKVTFVDELTQTPFTAQKVVKVKPPVAGAATRPATAPATQRTVDAKPGSRVFADPGEAKRIAYVFDVGRTEAEPSSQFEANEPPSANQSLFERKGSDPSWTQSEAQESLAKHILSLRSDQSFGIFTFRRGGSAPPQPSPLLLATRANMEKAMQSLGFLAKPTDRPRTALKLAFEAKPDLVYLVLTADAMEKDSSFSALSGLNSELNAKRLVTVHTLLHAVPTTWAEPRAELRRIAEENGGAFFDWNDAEEWTSTP